MTIAVKPALISRLTFFPKQALVFTCLLYKFKENTVSKVEISLFPTVTGELSAIFLKFQIVI